MTNKRICTLRQSSRDPEGFVVKFKDEVATFTGPNALDRAIAFAAAYPEGYYDGWRDPESLAQQLEDVDFLP